MFWTELLFSYFPIGRERFGQQILARFCFLLLVWLTGFLVYTLDGLMMAYLTNLSIIQTLFGTGFIVLFGSYMVQRSLEDLLPNVRTMLKLDEQGFRKFSERVEGYSYSFLPCILIALGLIFLSGSLTEFQQTFVASLELHTTWTLAFTFFYCLLAATGLWMFMSIWITVFITSRQPLNVKLSPTTIERFRDLSLLALWFALFYFLAIAIGTVTLYAIAPALSPLEIVISPFLFFIAIGIIGILFPFNNIHNALRKLKKQELLRIENETETLLQQLDAISAKQSPGQTSEQTVAIIARLLSLQIKERQVKRAPEWPIDVGFLSKLVVVVLIPIMVRASIEIFNRYF